MNLDSKILSDFFDTLNSLNIKYCVMNNYTEMPEVIPSDVDFAIELAAFYQLDEIVSQFSNKHNMAITQKIWHGYNKCAYILSPVHLDGFFRLQLDFFVDFCAKGYPNLLPNEKMLLNRRGFKNFFVPSPDVEAPFVMQRRIFKGDFSKRHLHIFQELYRHNKEKVISGFDEVFGQELSQEFINLINSSDLSLFESRQSFYKKKLKEISSKNTSYIYLSKYISMQFIRAIYRIAFPVGLNVTFIKDSSSYYEGIENDYLEIMSGSFHGIRVHELNQSMSPMQLFRFMLRKNWDRITKKISLVKVNLDKDKGLNKTQSLVLFLINNDIAFTSKNSLYEKPLIKPCLFNENDILNDLVSQSILKQETKTRKQFGVLFSPTSKTYSR